jgi:hypothetical protein
MGDAVGEHACLARAGAGENQERTVAVEHSLALRLVQPLEQRFCRGGCAHPGEDSCAGGGALA